ncbi:MAG: hypothetical protein ACTS22_01295 [Phycisphaerales bacterium]
MDATTHATATHAFQTILYSKALHPNLFDLRSRRNHPNPQFDLETWLMPGNHLIRFGVGDLCCCVELVTDRESGLPAEGVVNAFLCAGDRDNEFTFEPSGVKHLASVQTETLSENLYAATFREMLEHAEQNGCQRFEWETESGRNLSVLDVQTYRGEAHAQGYHLIASGGFVLRTQTLFELP